MKKDNNASNYKISKSNFTDWGEVFNNPAEIRVETLNTGIIVCKISGLLNLNNSNTKQLKDRFAEIPVLAHLIRHDKFGDYLIDTGFDSSFTNRIGGNYKGILKSLFFKNCYMQGQITDGIEFQLKERNIKINGVFLTHFHEHAAGAPSLPDDIPYVFGNGEAEISIPPLVYSDFFKNKINLQSINFLSGEDMHILGKCVDVFGDGSFWAVSTPGHSKGHISYIVNGKETKALIAGDACVTKKGFELGVEPGKFSSNIEKGRESFLKLLEFKKQYPLLSLLFGHETDEFKIKYRTKR